jgi:hypothetical protein
MAVMLYVTATSDGFSFPNTLSSYFNLYIQYVALSIVKDLLWHVSCDLPLYEEHEHCPTFCESGEF